MEKSDYELKTKRNTSSIHKSTTTFLHLKFIIFICFFIMILLKLLILCYVLGTIKFF